MIEIGKIKANDTYQFRIEELRNKIDLPYKFDGDLDDETLHLGLFKEGKLISVASFMKVSHKEFNGIQYQLRGMVTKSEFQGKGFGKKLLTYSEKLLKKIETNYLWCNARVKAVPFYKGLGFKISGNQFFIPQIGSHFVMFKQLIKTN